MKKKTDPIRDLTRRAALMLLLAVMTTTAGAQNTLVSHLDYCKAGVGSIYMAGWVYDSDPNTIRSWELGHGIEVITFVTTDPNETYDGYLPIPHETEYLVRDDVNKAYGLNGKHGFMAMVDFNPYVDLFQGDEGDLSERTFYVKIYGKFNPGTGSQSYLLHSAAVTVRKNLGEGSEDFPYVIYDADDWNSIADVLADHNVGPLFSNCYYQLAKDEDPDDEYDEGYDNTTAVTKMWGTSACPFTGHFDGNGMTLNVALNGAMHVAPFAYVNGAVIQNLTVGGTINASQYAGGIVGHGGSSTLTLQNCICAATISGFSNYAGGILGWCDDLTLTLQNCLFKGSFSPGSGGKYHPIALKNDVTTVTTPPLAFSYYLNTVAPSAELDDHVIKRAEGLPVSTELVDGVWDDPVTAIDGQTYYAAHFTGKTLPYEYGFENKDLSAEGWTMVNATRYTLLQSSKSAHSGNYEFEFSRQVGVRTPVQYLISPEFSGHSNILVSFYYKNENSSSHVCQVGYSTTIPDIDAFTWVETNTSTTRWIWDLYQGTFPKGTKYIAVNWFSEHGGALSIDDISFMAYDTPSPVNLMAIDVTENTASPSWEAPSALDHPITGYAYQYKKVSDADWTAGDPLPATITSATIDGLSADTDYQFRVKTLYGEHGESIWLSTQFTTATELPYEQGFENGMGRCGVVEFDWSCEGIRSVAAHSGGNGFSFTCSNFQHSLIFPRFAGTDDMVVSFYYRQSNATYISPRFQVGYSTTTSDPSVFTWGEEITAHVEWAFYERTFPAGTRFIAVRYSSVKVPKGQPNEAYASDNLFVDDFSFLRYSAYAKPTGLVVSDITDQSAKFTWTAPDASVTGYAYQYKKPTENAWSAEATTTATSITINGLEANTTYDFRVKALYTGGNASNYSTVRFFTEGATVNSLPFFEGFENGMGGWRISGSSSEIYSKGSDEIHNGNHSFELDQHEALISPRFDVNTSMLVSFYFKNYKDDTGSYRTNFQVGYSKTTKDLNDFTWGYPIATSGDWQEFSLLCPEGTKYVLIRLTGAYMMYLDDFTFTFGTPPSVPHDIAVTNITAFSADLSWTGDADMYDIRFRQKPLFFEDFANGLDQWKVVNQGGTTVTDWHIEESEFLYNHFAEARSYDIDTKTPYDVDNWLISPQVTLDGTLSFKAARNIDYLVHYEVRVSTTTDDISSFTDKVFERSNTDDIDDEKVSIDLSNFNGQKGYIAIRLNDSGQDYLTIDDFGISKSDLEWETGFTPNHVKLSNLQSFSEYEFQVRSDLYNIVSSWSDVVTFTTNRLAPIYDDNDNTELINKWAADMATHPYNTFNVMLVRRTLYKDGTWNSLCLPFGVSNLSGTPLEGATVKKLDRTDLGDDGTLTLNFTDATGIEAGKPYLLKWDLPTPDLFIRSAADWEAFAQNVNNGTESYEGKLVQLGADISISTMVGTADRPFLGTFDGAGYTLNVSINNAGAEYAAPFRYISGATIRNLKVTGTVNGGQYSAGIVGAALGGTNSIRDCWMAASVSGSNVGGILGHGTASVTTISNCFLNGSLTASYIGVLYGGGSNGGTHAVENCWVRGTYPTILFDGGIDLVLADGGTISVINCRQNIGEYAQGTPEGVVVVVGEGNIDTYCAEFLGGQWTVNDNGGLALKHTTDATNIVSPVFNLVRVSNTLTPVETDHVNFIGITSPATLAADDSSLFYLDTDNTLHHPAADMTLNACRGYFQLNNPSANVNTIVLNFGDVEILLGDVNNDNKVTPADAIMILYHYFGVAQNGFNEAAADLNGDSHITPADAIEALYKYFGSSSNNARRARPTKTDEPMMVE